MQQILADLVAERDELRAMLVGRPETDFDRMTPAEPWTVRDQIGHLAFFDEEATKAASDVEAFSAGLEQMARMGGDAYMAQHIDRGRSMSSPELIDWLTSAETAMVAALATHDTDERLPWYGPPMRARSFAVARLMETWAHAQDVADGLGVDRRPTDRLFEIAELGVRTFRFSYENRGLEVPDTRVRVALRGPTGTVRVWNDEYDDSVTGPVEEFCLVVTQRRHLADTHLVVEGPVAAEWMTIAQAFAGPPGTGRAPSS